MFDDNVIVRVVDVVLGIRATTVNSDVHGFYVQISGCFSSIVALTDDDKASDGTGDCQVVSGYGRTLAIAEVAAFSCI